MRREDIDAMPWKKFQEFCIYIELLVAKENENNRSQRAR
jgi:hypothetical protein